MSNIVHFPSGHKVPGYVPRPYSAKDFSVIAAVALNGTIGDSTSNSIPWHLPTDFKWFKEVTLGKTVLMGSRTYESIKRPLPKRRNIVISRDLTKCIRYVHEGIDKVYADPYTALSEEDNVFVIGGQSVYEIALDLHPKHLYITIVNLDIIGDVKFPIAGHTFHDDVVAHGLMDYTCGYRSEWHKENNVEFQFTRFDRD